MLVERDSVTKERFIATGFVLLVDLLVLEELDLLLHGGDLTLQVVDDFSLQFLGAGCLSLGTCSTLFLLSGSF